jgi:hypothetical protein
MYRGVPTMAPSRVIGAVNRSGSGAVAARLRALRHLGAGEAEVEDTDAAVGADQHVVGLEVAVHEPGSVRGGEAFARGEHLPVALALAHARLQPLAKGAALDELGRDEEAAVGAPDLVHGHHVRVVQAREGLRFAQEAVAPLRAHAVGGGLQELQRDGAFELAVVSLVDNAHSAFADDVDEHVAAHDGAARERRHGQRAAGLRP